MWCVINVGGGGGGVPTSLNVNGPEQVVRVFKEAGTAQKEWAFIGPHVCHVVLSDVSECNLLHL